MESLQKFFEIETLYYTNNNNKKCIVNFGLGTQGEINQELDSKWFKKYGKFLCDHSHRKVLYLIDSGYKNHLSDDFLKHLALKINENGEPGLQCKADDFMPIDRYFDIKSFENHKIEFTVHIIPYKLSSDYCYDKQINMVVQGMGINSCYDSVPKNKMWNYFASLMNTFLKINSEIYINNNIITNSRVPIKIDNRVVYKHLCIGYFLEYTSELGYIIKKLSYNHELKNHVYIKNYKNGDYNIVNVTLLKDF